MTAAEVRLACSSDLFGSIRRAKAFGLITHLGFRYVELWWCSPMSHHVEPLEEGSAAVRAELEREGLKASSLSLFLTTHKEKMAGIEFCGELGASSIISESGPSADWPTI